MPQPKTYAVTIQATLTLEILANDGEAARAVIMGAFAPDLPVDPLAETRVTLPNWRPFVTDSVAYVKTCTVDPDSESSVKEA